MIRPIVFFWKERSNAFMASLMVLLFVAVPVFVLDPAWEECRHAWNDPYVYNDPFRQGWFVRKECMKKWCNSEREEPCQLENITRFHDKYGAPRAQHGRMRLEDTGYVWGEDGKLKRTERAKKPQ